MVTNGFHRSAAIAFGILATMLIVPNLVVAVRSSPSRVATVTGQRPPETPGSVLYETACASCHGKKAQGGTGPALAGHTEEQVVRQVRAPVGKMPMFSPQIVSDHGLGALVELIEGLETREGAEVGGHAHDANLLSKQEVSQIQHALILRSLEQRREGAASHAAEEVLDLLSGNHLVAMTMVLEDIQSNQVGPAQEALTNMAANAPLTTDLTAEDLLLTLVLNSLRDHNVDRARHWLGHIEDSDHDHVVEISAALNADAMEAAIELVERALPEPDAEEHNDDADAHVDDEEAHSDPEMDMDDEDAHVDEDAEVDDSDAHVDEDTEADDSDAHVDDADAHTDPELPEHDDGDAAPHGH